MGRPASEIGREHGCNGKRIEKADGHNEADSHTELPEELPNHTLQKRDWPKHGYDCKRSGNDCELYLKCPSSSCLQGRFPHFHVSKNVFTYHNGVIDQQSDGKAESQESHNVDGETCC